MRGKGSLRRQERGGGSLLIIPGGGGVSQVRGETNGAGRVSAGNWGGGGLTFFFFFGAEIPTKVGALHVLAFLFSSVSLFFSPVILVTSLCFDILKPPKQPTN